MNSKGRILVAFLLNLFFSIFEIIGGFLTNSISIMSDSLHDLADALSIGISYFLEKKSEKRVRLITAYPVFFISSKKDYEKDYQNYIKKISK